MLALGSGCAKSDWIGRTLVTVDVTGTWRSGSMSERRIALSGAVRSTPGRVERRALSRAAPALDTMVLSGLWSWLRAPGARALMAPEQPEHESSAVKASAS